LEGTSIDKTTVILAVVMVSELVAIWLITKIARTDDYLLLKMGLALIALIPVVGPLMTLWIANFPPSQPPGFQDRVGRGADVTHRWQDFFRETDTEKKLEKYRKARNDEYM
jgi:hypothetical protein